MPAVASSRHRTTRLMGRGLILFGLLTSSMGMAWAGGLTPARADTAIARPLPSPDMMALLKRRCGACHASHPSMMATAPSGLDFDRTDVVSRHDYDIYNQVAVRRSMPLGNITHMTDDERAQIARWYHARVAAGKTSP